MARLAIEQYLKIIPAVKLAPQIMILRQMFCT
jgi:hypothetical protein